MRILLLLPFRLARWGMSTLFRLLRWVVGTRRRPVTGLFGRLGQVVLLALVLLPFTGFVREEVVRALGHDFDRLALDQLAGLRDGVREFLAGFIVSTTVVEILLLVLQYALFATVAVLFASVVSRLPFFTSFLVLADYERRRGNAFSRGAIVLGLTLPVCLGWMVACQGAMSLLAWFHVLIVFGYVRLRCDPVRLNKTLDWAARVQGGPDDPHAAGADDDGES